MNAHEEAFVRSFIVPKKRDRYLRRGTVLCCVPGKLAFYKEEDIGDAFVLERKQ